MTLQIQREIAELKRRVERLAVWEGGSASKQYATFVVAANDTTAAGKAKADYVCDGTADDVEINAALSVVTASTYRRVLLLEGTYNITAAITVEAQDTLEGQGYGSVLKIHSSAASTMNTITLNNYSRVANLFINGNAIGGTKTGVYADSATGCQAEGLYIDDMSSRGMHFSECTQSQAIRNLVTNCTSIGIQFRGGNNNNIVGNVCYGNSSGILLGLVTTSEMNSVVTGNTCIRNTYGIYLSEALYNTVSGNNCAGVFGDLGDYGIFVDQSHYNVIGDNVCSESSTAGIYVTLSDSNRIADNLCIGNSWSTSTNPATNSSAGISLDESDRNYLAGNLIRKSLSGASEIQQYGIQIQNSTCNNNIVIDNDLYLAGNTTFSDSGTDTYFRTPSGATNTVGLTISTGVVAVNGSGYYALVPETGTADDLDTINSGQNGEIITLRVQDSGDTITVKDGTGNIDCAGDFAMDTQSDTMRLIYDSALAVWLELSRSNNA